MPSMSQWQNIAGPDIGTIPSAFGGFGFIHYQAGSVWAGRDNLFVSRDSGVTWTQLTPPVNGTITEINFFNTQIGVVATTSGVYKTMNGGATWTLILNRSFVYGAQFAGSADRIVAATDGNSPGFYYSTDGGVNWNYSARSSHPHFVLTYPNGTAYAQTGSNIYCTTDFGLSWQQKGGIDYDSWYLVQDSSSFLFLMNEEGHVFSDNLASFCRSSDGAISWQKTTARTPQYYTGGISASKCAVYCQTLADGIVRSVDAGLTWISIGGPNNFIDTRLVCAINSQIIIAADGNGQLWRTANSGGLGMPSEHAQFSVDKPKELAISICDVTDIIPVIYRLSSNCSGIDLHITSAIFEGSSSTLFTLISEQPPFVIKGNSASRMNVRFTAPNISGLYSSLLHITGYYRDGTGNSIPYDTTISLSALVEAAPPMLKSNIGTVNFSMLTPCDQGRDTTITFTNNGCDTLTILSGPGECPPGFSFDSIALPLLLPPGISVSIRFHFDPTDSGEYVMNAILEAESNGIRQFLPVTLRGSLRGSMPDLLPSDSVVAFRTITTCDPGTDTIITLTNIGCDTLKIISGPGPLSEGFSIDPLDFPIVLAPGQSLTLTVHFDAPGLGSFDSKVKFETDSRGQLSEVHLRLLGTSLPVQPELSANLTMLKFDTVSTCNSPVDTTIVLANTGCDTLVITGGPGPLPPEFVMMGITLPIILPPDSSLILQFSFFPSGNGSFTASPVFVYERYGLQRSVSFFLDGSGVEGIGVLSSAPPAFHFDPIPICFEDSLDGYITNKGCDTLMLDNVSLFGDADYQGSLPTAPYALAPGDTLRYTLYLKPTSKGTRNSILTITAHSAHGSQISYTDRVFIDGLVNDGSRTLAASHQDIQFGITTLCELPDSILTLFNEGCDTLTITAADIKGRGFLSDAALPIVIPPGQRKEIRISSVLDTTDGVAGSEATISFVSNAENQLQPIRLRRDYQYPKRHTIKLIEAEAMGSSGEVIRFDLRVDGELIDVSTIDLDLDFNSDILGFLSVEGPNRITFADGHIHISGFPIISDSSGIIGSIFFEIYLTKDSLSILDLSNLKLNEGDPYFERCIASVGDLGGNFTYVFRCGERLLSKYMGSVQIFSIISVRPNPTYDEVELTVNAQQETDLVISVYDALGKQMLTDTRQISSGIANINMDVRNLGTGIYYIEAKAANTRTSTSFVKIR